MMIPLLAGVFYGFALGALFDHYGAELGGAAIVISLLLFCVVSFEIFPRRP